jgi:hypothetical protein
MSINMYRILLCYISPELSLQLVLHTGKYYLLFFCFTYNLCSFSPLAFFLQAIIERMGELDKLEWERRKKNVLMYISLGWNIISTECVLPYLQVTFIFYVQFIVPVVPLSLLHSNLSFWEVMTVFLVTFHVKIRNLISWKATDNHCLKWSFKVLSFNTTDYCMLPRVRVCSYVYG